MEANLTYLRREVMKYERDPNHTITPHHIKLRMSCVVKFGAEVVREIVASVCQELINERQRLFPELCKRPVVGVADSQCGSHHKKHYHPAKGKEKKVNRKPNRRR